MNENLMMTIPQLMYMIESKGATLGYTIAISHPNVEEPKNRYNTVTNVKIARME